MAAAAIQSVLPRHIPGSTKGLKAAEDIPRPPHDDETEQREKRLIASFSNDQRPLPPEQISEDPKHKELGGSSTQLRLESFDLLKTLGTGQCNWMT